VNLLVPAWNRALALLLVAVAAYLPTWRSLWGSFETHESLIVLLAVWLVWRARRTLAAAPAEGDLRAVPLVLFASAAWLLAEKANSLTAHTAIWPVLAFTIIWGGVGWSAALRFAFPLSFLYFAIPIWTHLEPPLQALASVMVGALASAVGVTATIDGPYVTIPGNTIYIALGCSGAHFLGVALAIGALAGALRGDNVQTRIMILIGAGVLSIAFNWLRILIIVLAYANPPLKPWIESIDHATFGWWVFAMDLFVFCLALRWIPIANPAGSPVSTPETPPRRSRALPFVVALIASAFLPVSSWGLTRLGAPPPNALRVAAEIDVPPGAVTISPDYRWRPEFPGAAWTHRLAYVREDGRFVEVYVNEYHHQAQGAELISDTTPVFSRSAFDELARNVVEIHDGVVTAAVNKVELLDKTNVRWLAMYAYAVNGRLIAPAWRTQLRTALLSVYGHPTAGLIAVMMRCERSCASVAPHLEEAFFDAYRAYEGTHNDGAKRSSRLSSHGH
jgi:EpsI family protein